MCVLYSSLWQSLCIVCELVLLLACRFEVVIGTILVLIIL
jgi:hypothetical protein